MSTIDASTVTFKNVEELLKVCAELASKNICMFAESTVIQDLNGWTIRVNRTCGESVLLRESKYDNRNIYKVAKAAFEKVRNDYSMLQGRLSTVSFLGEKEPVIVFLRALEAVLPKLNTNLPKMVIFPN